MSTKEAMRRAEKNSRQRRRERGVERLSVELEPDAALIFRAICHGADISKTAAVHALINFAAANPAEFGVHRRGGDRLPELEGDRA